MTNGTTPPIQKINLMGDQDRVPHGGEAAIASELVNHFAEITQLADAELRRDYLGHLPKEDFITEVQTVNAIIRGQETGSIQPFDNEGTVLATHDVPRKADQEELMGDIWEGVQKILTDPELDAEKALEYAGALTGLGILYIHPFDDSNGRTSRTFARVIREGTDDGLSADLENSLSEDGASYERLNNLMFGGYINDAVPSYSSMQEGRDFPEFMSNVRRVNYNPSDEPLVLAYDEVAKDQGVTDNFRKSNFAYYTMATFMKNIDQEGYEQIKSHIGDDGVLEFGAALEELAQGERAIEYMSQLRDADQYVRALFVKRFVEAMTDGASATLRREETAMIERSAAKEEATSPSDRLGKLLLAQSVERPDSGREIVVRDLIVASHQAYSKQRRTEAA